MRVNGLRLAYARQAAAIIIPPSCRKRESMRVSRLEMG